MPLAILIGMLLLVRYQIEKNIPLSQSLEFFVNERFSWSLYFVIVYAFFRIYIYIKENLTRYKIYRSYVVTIGIRLTRIECIEYEWPLRYFHSYWYPWNRDETLIRILRMYRTTQTLIFYIYLLYYIRLIRHYYYNYNTFFNNFKNYEKYDN